MFIGSDFKASQRYPDASFSWVITLCLYNKINKWTSWNPKSLFRFTWLSQSGFLVCLNWFQRRSVQWFHCLVLRALVLEEPPPHRSPLHPSFHACSLHLPQHPHPNNQPTHGFWRIIVSSCVGQKEHCWCSLEIPRSSSHSAPDQLSGLGEPPALSGVIILAHQRRQWDWMASNPSTRTMTPPPAAPPQDLGHRVAGTLATLPYPEFCNWKFTGTK